MVASWIIWNIKCFTVAKNHFLSGVSWEHFYDTFKAALYKQFECVYYMVTRVEGNLMGITYVL